ncbi:MAG: hypothetical protein R3F38_06185 [Gammaproteobacteria bacterium]
MHTHGQGASYTLGDLIHRYIDEFVAGGRFGRSKQFDLQKLLKTDIAAVGLDTLQTSDLVQHIRERLEEGVKPQTANNDLVWIRVVLKTARPAWEFRWICKWSMTRGGTLPQAWFDRAAGASGQAPRHWMNSIVF